MNKSIILLLSLLLVPVQCLGWWEVHYQEVAGGDSCAAGINTGSFSETFDTNPGYDNSWSVGGGTPDPDNTNAPVLAECGFDGETFRANSTGTATYSKQTKTGTWGPEYTRDYIYIASHSLAVSGGVPIVQFDTDTGGALIEVYNNAGQLELRGWWGGGSKKAFSISTGVSYRVEMLTNDPDGLGGVGSGEVRFYLGDSETPEDSWSGAININSIMTEDRIGVIGSGDTVDVYIDHHDVQSTGWIGK